MVATPACGRTGTVTDVSLGEAARARCPLHKLNDDSEVSGYAVSLIKLMTRIVTPTEPRMSRLWGHFSWASHYGGGRFIEGYAAREGVGDHGHWAGG